MKLRPYPEYKDSRVEWIGKLPKEWEINKIKYTSYVKGRIGWQGLRADEFIDKGPYLITGTNFKDGGIDWEDCYHISKERYKQDPFIHVKENDIIITKDGTIGKVAFISNLPDKTSLNSHLLIIRSLYGSYYSKYLFWLLQSRVFLDYIEISKVGTTFFGITQEEVEKFKFPIPSLSEQINIEKYLDKKTSEIDLTIEKDTHLIELLKEKRTALINHVVTKGLDSTVKMKDSGVEWIGEIPEKAEIVPFRRICNLNQGLQFPQAERLSEPDENSKIYITIKYIHSNKELKEYIPNPPKRVVCDKDDVLLARTGATGEVVTDQEGVFHNNFFRVNYDNTVNKNYLVYYLKMDAIKELLLLKAGVTTIPDLNHDDFLDTPFILYPLDEQEGIANQLDTENFKINSIIQKIKQNIDLLEEYKKSLIHHVVTGKVDVREVAV